MISCPHYFTLSTEALKPQNTNELHLIVRATGAVAANINSTAALKKCTEFDEAKIGLWFNYPYESNYLNLLEQHLLVAAEIGVKPTFVMQGHEGTVDEPTMLEKYYDKVKEIFPTAAYGIYHYPDWTLSPWGYGEHPMYKDVTLYCDVATTSLYHEDAAANNIIFQKTKEYTLKKIIPVFGGLFYKSIYRGAGKANWHSVIEPRPAVFWHTFGRQMAKAWIRGQIAGCYLWNTFYDPRVPMSVNQKMWTAYSEGWNGNELHEEQTPDPYSSL